MRRMIRALALTLVLTCVSSALPSKADAFFWIGARGDYFSGSGDHYKSFENPLGGGFELGIDIAFISIFVEGIFFPDQVLTTVNVGVNFTFGDALRFSVGAFTGPIMFWFPEYEPAGGVDLRGLTTSDQQLLIDAFGLGSIADVESTMDSELSQLDDLGRFAFGWNLVRARLAVDYNLFGPIRLGVASHFGYDYLISGEEVANGAENEVINQFEAQYGLPTELTDSLRTAVGSEEVNTDSLNGVNYGVNLFFRIEI